MSADPIDEIDEIHSMRFPMSPLSYIIKAMIWLESCSGRRNLNHLKSECKFPLQLSFVARLTVDQI